MNDDERICARLRGNDDDDVEVRGLCDETRATLTVRLRRITDDAPSTVRYMNVDDARRVIRSM